MRSRLCSLKKRLEKTTLDDGKSICSRGRLTDKVIDYHQVYYGKTIKNNTHSIKDIEKVVIEISHHRKSADQKPDQKLHLSGEKFTLTFIFY